MMNKSKIEWTDFTWNPVTGCLHGCEYCYAAKQAQRFSGDIRLNKGSDQLRKDENGLYILDSPFRNQATGRVTPHPVGFEPAIHKYRLPMVAQKKKPAKIFVCSMADLFGAWVPDSWIEEVFKACDAAPWHTYLFLTKNPSRYIELAEKGIIRTAKNYWYGTTITGPNNVYFWSANINTFASIEPILEKFEYPEHTCSGERLLKWVIIGAETGNRKGKVKPERSWIENIVKACKETKTPVFLKDNLKDIWGEELIQEWPAGMPIDMGNDVPHCKKCKYHGATQEGKRGERHECELEGKHIPGRYARTSPPWCPKRREEKQK
jgi:protein gp37